MRKLLVFAFGTLLTSLGLLPAARADGIQSLNFTLTYINSNEVWSFTLPQNPTPDAFGDGYFYLYGVQTNTPTEPCGAGLPSLCNSASYDIFVSKLSAGVGPQLDMICGGVPVCDNPLKADFPTDLFSGPTNAPSFIPGNYVDSAWDLSVTPVPEPPVIVLTSIGLLAICLLLAAPRRDRRHAQEGL